MYNGQWVWSAWALRPTGSNSGAAATAAYTGAGYNV